MRLVIGYSINAYKGTLEPKVFDKVTNIVYGDNGLSFNDDIGDKMFFPWSSLLFVREEKC